MANISWAYGLLGGLMIGTAAVVNGKIMGGASGIIGGLGSVGLLPWLRFGVIKFWWHRWFDFSGSHVGGNGDCPVGYPRL